MDAKTRGFMKWMKTPEATTISEAAKDNAWKPFLAKYPNADRTKFVAQVEFAYNHTATADIYYKAGQGHLINVFGSDSKYWSPEMKKALGVNQISGGFPQQLSPSGAKGSSLPIPAVGFHEAAPSLKKIFNSQINIYVTPDQYFTTKLREIFQKTKLKHTSGKESKRWLASQNMGYWPQQLNFAVWCATTGSGAQTTDLVTFISGLLSIGPNKTGAKYPDYDKFSDEGGAASKGNLIQYIEPDDAAYAQADWFCPNGTEGLTQAGLSRVNQSIEAFVYCILGSQVNVRSSILGTGGRAKEAQSEFLVLVEDAIRQPDLAKSVQRYQLAIDEAKVRLNLAVCPGAWLMPARMVINTESVVGYNNQLKQAVVGMKLGVNDEVNKATKKAALKLMAGGKSKINPPNSHPSNPIYKSATAKKNQAPAASAAETQASNAQSAKPTKAVANDSHEINKATVAVGAVGAAALLYTLMR
ncbi:hypothetical protein ACROYT_G019971 [Oculina patagonica]